MPGIFVPLIPWIGLNCVSPPNARAYVLQELLSTSSFSSELAKRASKPPLNECTPLVKLSVSAYVYSTVFSPMFPLNRVLDSPWNNGAPLHQQTTFWPA